MLKFPSILIQISLRHMISSYPFFFIFLSCVYSVSFAAGVPSLIFSNGRDLLIGDIHGNNLRTLVNSQNRGVAVGVDFHYNLHRIFWTDTIQNKVFFIPFL